MTLNIRDQLASELVNMKNGTISREIFVDPDLYEIEKEQVFARCWLFVGFEDQVRKPGDYFVSRMGEESVILSRDRDNTIHVFLNSCRHRGMKVCRYDEGNTPVFTCPYHGWSYAGDGSLVGVPRYKDAYREELDKSQWGVVEVAQLANVRGTIWATWDPDAPSFDEYLGDIKPYLEMWFDKPDGSEADLEVIGGVYKWTLPCNWKFGAENFNGDMYHGRPTHRSVDLLRLSPSGQQGRHTNDNVSRPGMMFNLAHHGHGRIALGYNFEDQPYAPTYPNNPVAEEYFRDAYERRKKLLGDRSKLRNAGGGTIFPNGTTGTGDSMCVWQPNGPDSTEQWRWFFVQRDAPQEVKDMMRHYLIRYGGPGGLTEEDDMENWNYAHRASKGTIAKRYPYNYSIGLGHDQRESKVPWLVDRGLIAEQMTTEMNQRRTYKLWADLMSGTNWDKLRTDELW